MNSFREILRNLIDKFAQRFQKDKNEELLKSLMPNLKN